MKSLPLLNSHPHDWVDINGASFNLKQCSVCSLYRGDVYVPERKRLTHTNRKDLESKLAGLKVDHERQQSNPSYEPPKPAITFQEAVELYKRLYLLPNGQTSDLANLGGLVDHFKPNTLLKRIDKEGVKEWGVAMLAKGWQKQTIRRRLTLLSGIFREAIPKYITVNPCKGAIKFPKGIKKSRKRWFTDQEMQTIYARLQEPKPLKKHAHTVYGPKERMENVLYAVIARNMGLRPDNMTRLEWTDLNMKEDVLTAKDTKNGRTYQFKMNTAARKAFLQLWELKGKPQNGLVFRGCNWSRLFTTLYRELGWNDTHLPKENRKIAENNQAVLYSFRHTFASHLVMRGYTGKALWEAMGWENGSEEATYSHLSPSFKATMVDTISCDYVSAGDKLLEEAKREDD